MARKKKGKKKGEEPETPIAFVAMAEIGGKLHEVVHSNGTSRFVWLDKEGPGYTDKLLWDGVLYLPENNVAVKHKAVILPEAVQEYGSEEELLEELQSFVHRYVDVSPDYEIFSCYYILLSWVYDKLTTVPYLRALGDFSTGKSRLLDVVGKLCYKPIVMAGTVTASPMYRLQGFWKGTLLIDEADRQKSDESQDIVKILNCGFEKGKPVLRSNRNRPNDIEVHDPFGPKLICSRFTFWDNALESRCLTENMTETQRDDVPVILPPKFYEEQEALRQKLLMFRLRERPNIDANIIQQINLGNIEKRLKQALSSFAVLFANKPKLFERFKAFVMEYQGTLIDERATTLDGLLINYLMEREENEDIEAITPQRIAEYLQEEGLTKVGSRTVGRHLKALGIITKPVKHEGKTQRLIQWNKNLMPRLFEKYNRAYWTLSHSKRNGRAPRNQKPKKVTKGTKVTTLTGERALVCANCSATDSSGLSMFNERWLCPKCYPKNEKGVVLDAALGK